MRFGNLCVHARTIACIFCYFCCCHEYRNRCRFIVARRRLRRAGFALLSLRRDNARLSDERAAADVARRLAEESRRVSEEKSAAAEIEIRTLVERSTLAQARLEAAEQRMAEARAEREKMEETFRTQFKNLANDILGEQSRTFKETNREALDVLLKPSGITSWSSASGSRRSTPPRTNSGGRCATSLNA